MRRLSVRLLASHILVAVLAGGATYVVVRFLAPRLFDDMIGLGYGPGGAGQGPGRTTGGQGQGFLLKQQFADAVDSALLIGTVVGVLAAALFGILAARRLLRPLDAVRATTREIAAGRYDVRVAVPSAAELAALASDVNTLGATLAETEARRVRLLGEVAHELRTPLTVIDGSVEGMIDGVVATGPEELGRLADEVRRLRRLADDLSTLSRAEEGRLSVTAVPVDVRAVVSAAAERLRPQAADAGLTLEVVGGDPVQVDADPDRIAQVVTNLVGNAIRATQPGGVVTVSVSGAGKDADGRASISVADTGEGLDADDCRRVFERFYRVPGRRGGPDGGSGIGLTIARQIMRAHGGDLTASSDGRGRGATFVATLPVAH